MQYESMSKTKITPKDLIAQDTELEIPGQDPVQIRAVNIDDWSWMQTKFGKDIEKALGNLPVNQLMMILYRLMDDEGKTRFAPRDIETFDDDGEKLKVRKTGPQMLATKIKGLAGLQSAVEAFQMALGVSTDAINELGIEEKGNIEPIKKKTNRATRRTGQKSMTS